MIDIRHLLSTNVEMLEKQEQELKQALNVVQKVKNLILEEGLETEGTRVTRKRGRKKRTSASEGVIRSVRKRRKRRRRKARKVVSVTLPAASAPQGETASSPAEKSKSKAAGGKLPRKGTWLDQILQLIKSEGPDTSPKIVEKLFKQQKKVKDPKQFRKLIYPVLTRAYQSKLLVKKKGVIHLS
jgi:hypothetical protein